MQCEAIPSSDLHDIVRDAVESHTDMLAVQRLELLSREVRPDLAHAITFEAADVAAEVRDELHNIAADAENFDWTGGYDGDT